MTTTMLGPPRSTTTTHPPHPRRRQCGHVTHVVVDKQPHRIDNDDDNAGATSPTSMTMHTPLPRRRRGGHITQVVHDDNDDDNAGAHVTQVNDNHAHPTSTSSSRKVSGHVTHLDDPWPCLVNDGHAASR